MCKVHAHLVTLHRALHEGHSQKGPRRRRCAHSLLSGDQCYRHRGRSQLLILDLKQTLSQSSIVNTICLNPRKSIDASVHMTEREGSGSSFCRESADVSRLASKQKNQAPQLRLCPCRRPSVFSHSKRQHLFKPTYKCWSQEVFGLCLLVFITLWEGFLESSTKLDFAGKEKKRIVAQRACLGGQHGSAQTEQFDRKMQTL